MEPGPAVLRGWALRHALCFALAERDTRRLAALKATRGVDAGLARGFQALFALLDGPTPPFRLWRLPELDYQDLELGALGTRRIWIGPMEPGLRIPPGTAWIIPSATGALGERESALHGPVKVEAEELASKVKALGHNAWFAASAQEWEHQGFSYFPALIELDDKGNLTRIQMGDAAPGRP